MNCSNCGEEILEGAKFCIICGKTVTQIKKCINCGIELSEKVKFCPDCGTNQNGSSTKSTFFSIIERLNLNEATELFYEQGNENKAYELLEPIYKVHPYSEEVLNVYLQVLIKTDIEYAKRIISKSNVDILSIFMAEIEIAIIEKDLDLAERKINQAKQLWQTNMLKCYEARFYLELTKYTGKKCFLSSAEEIAQNFEVTEDKLELSYQKRILKNIAEYKNEDTSYYTIDFCKENNLYSAVVLGFTEERIIVGKNQIIKSLKEALEVIKENGTIILEPGVYNEHINFDIKVNLVGLRDSIMEKSSCELPVIVLDSTKTCKITADVKIEGVVFTHEKNLSFEKLQNYADTKYEFNKDKEIVEFGVDGYTAIEISNKAILKNIALLDAQNRGFVFTQESGILDNSLVAHSYWHNIVCYNASSPKLTNSKSVNSNGNGLYIGGNANPSLKDCDIYECAEVSICIEDQARGTLEGCYIHDIENDNGLYIGGNATPKFRNCKIHGNYTEYSLVYVGETANPSLKDCEIYKGSGIYVEDQASGTFEDCDIYDIGYDNGLHILGNATPKFINCKIHQNTKYSLVYVGETANPSLKDCEIYKGFGLSVEEQASGTFEGCNIHDIAYDNSLQILGNATPKFINCKIHGNYTEYSLVYVGGTANPSLKDCEMYKCAEVCIYVKDQASGIFEGCDIHDISFSNGLRIEGNATPKFINCKIHDNKRHSLVYVGGNANPCLKDCDIYDCANVVLDDTIAAISVYENAIGSYINCYLHNNEGKHFSNHTSNYIDISTCRMENF